MYTGYITNQDHAEVAGDYEAAILVWYKRLKSMHGQARNVGRYRGPAHSNGLLARICHPVKLEAERIDGTDRRFAPGHELPGSGLGARRVHELRIFSRHTRRAGQKRWPTP